MAVLHCPTAAPSEFNRLIRSEMETPYNRYMTKSELILRLAKRHPHLYKSNVERAVDTIFGEITEALVRGDRVELRGFGAFFVRKRKARTARNPRSGEIVTVPAKPRPYFRTGKALRERLNGGYIAATDSFRSDPVRSVQTI